MSKNILSKIKPPQQKDYLRSSSVGNDSCLRDEALDYSQSCRHHGHELSSTRRPDSLEEQVRRLESINDRLSKHLWQIGETGREEFEESRKHYRHRNKNNYYLEPPGPLDHIEHLQGKYGCDLINSTRMDHARRPSPKFRSTCYQQMERLQDLDYSRKIPFQNHSSVRYAPPCRNKNESGQMQCKDPKPCTSMINFKNPSFQIFPCPNDRQSNSSDASHQSSTTRQNVEVGIDLFNWNSNCGIDYFRSNGIVNQDTDLVELFLRKKNFNKKKLSEFLTNPKNRSIHKAFCDSMNLKNKEIIAVLREYLKFSYINGETAEVLSILEDISMAYLKQHPVGGVMGLNFEQINTIFLFLITFKDTGVHGDKKISRDQFVKMLQDSLTEALAVNRQLAACLYIEISEQPLVQVADKRIQDLNLVSNKLLDLPKDFKLLEYHRYPINQVDMIEIIISGITEKPVICQCERTVFLFNDCMILTKKTRILESKGYRFKRIIPLDDIRCILIPAAVMQLTAAPTGQLMQIKQVSSGNDIACFQMKLFEDLVDFQSSLDHALSLHKATTDYKAVYQAKLQ